MKNPFKKSDTALDLNNVGKILSTGAATGMAIASFAGKKANVGGIIGAGLSLLIGGLLVALQEDDLSRNSNNN
ncbi:hypothetical protein LVDJXP189_1910002 [Flavobacterium psychrophilum]|uniref:hypothetical protein n=1 Tax=Flavobacterium psychrophilum TaxID=96345 RepID=UPI000B7C291C|nr:hypothetical protein [Flavobacterium psychrophilum]MCB6062476.1 hypothetical protein [Flavobacterium psychrophilum]SNB42830.1 hypothetical protein LVDJXP189_1910002 [Flavobacterium psychrophilum]